MLVIFCGVLVSPVAIGMMASYPNQIWWLGLVLVVSCGLMIYGGIQSIRKSQNATRQAAEEEQRINEEVAQLNALDKTQNESIERKAEAAISDSTYHEVIAHWTFTPQEWKKFLILEKQRRKSSTLIEGSLIVVLGTPFLMWVRLATLGTAFIISVVIAIVISFFRYLLTMSSLGSILPVNEVAITDQTVMINGKLNPYRSENFWLDKIRILDGDPDVLEITYAWNTRKGKTFDELRVPIPPGKKEEARVTIQKILKIGQ